MIFVDAIHYPSKGIYITKHTLFTVSISKIRSNLWVIGDIETFLSLTKLVRLSITNITTFAQVYKDTSYISMFVIKYNITSLLYHCAEYSSHEYTYKPIKQHFPISGRQNYLCISIT